MVNNSWRAHFYIIIIIIICFVSFSAPVNTADVDVEPVRRFVKNRNNDRAMTKQRRVINAFKIIAIVVIKVTKTRFSDVTIIYHVLLCRGTYVQ